LVHYSHSYSEFLNSNWSASW